MNFLSKKNGYIIILILSISCAGCSFVEVDLPKDRITAATLFKNETTAVAAVLGLYGSLVQTTPPFSNGSTTIFTGLASDELLTTTTLDIYLQFYNNQIAIDNSIVATNFWRSAYEIIYQANACLEGLEKSSNISLSMKNQLMGEVYFIRAFCYFYLVNLFNDVPLIVHTDYKKNATLPKTSAALVKEHILSDLMKAKNMISKSYPSVGKLRVNYYTVLALLSRFYLYQEKWQQVLESTDEIINSTLYGCETSITNIFLNGSKETIWQLATDQSRFNTVEGNRFIPSVLPNFKPPFIISSALMDAFDPNDLRKINWIGSKMISGVAYKYPYKYKVSLNTKKTEDYVMFRLAEIYLNRAEAFTHLGNNAHALKDLNILRARAGLSDRTIENTPDVISAVLSERRIELFVEWGHRWFDLKRTNKINEVLSNRKPNWVNTAQWFPIPAVEISANPNLVQNSGY